MKSQAFSDIIRAMAAAQIANNQKESGTPGDVFSEFFPKPTGNPQIDADGAINRLIEMFKGSEDESEAVKAIVPRIHPSSVLGFLECKCPDCLKFAQTMKEVSGDLDALDSPSSLIKKLKEMGPEGVISFIAGEKKYYTNLCAEHFLVLAMVKGDESNYLTFDLNRLEEVIPALAQNLVGIYKATKAATTKGKVNAQAPERETPTPKATVFDVLTVSQSKEAKGDLYMHMVSSEHNSFTYLEHEDKRLILRRLDTSIGVSDWVDSNSNVEFESDFAFAISSKDMEAFIAWFDSKVKNLDKPSFTKLDNIWMRHALSTGMFVKVTQVSNNPDEKKGTFITQSKQYNDRQGRKMVHVLLLERIGPDSHNIVKESRHTVEEVCTQWKEQVLNSNDTSYITSITLDKYGIGQPD